MIYLILKALAPIMVTMALGYQAGKSKLVDNNNVFLLNIFLMDFALPSALFIATIQTPWEGIIRQLPLILIICLSMWTAYATVYFSGMKLFGKSPPDAAVFALTVALPNYAALGLPVLDGVFGESPDISLNVAISICCGSVLVTPLCLMTLEAAKSNSNARPSFGTLLFRLIAVSFRKPIVFAPLAGVLASFLLHLAGWQVSELLVITLKPLAGAALAAALFLTGVILSARRLKINAPVIFGVLIKNIVQPFFAWGIALAFGIAPAVGHAGVLLVALSTGFFGVVFGNRYGAQSADAEGTLLVSSAAFIITIPLFIVLTSSMSTP
jgi:malonate transporter